MGCSALEPNAHDVHMYKGAVSGRAESILRSTDASALGNSVQCLKKNTIRISPRVSVKSFSRDETVLTYLMDG